MHLARPSRLASLAKHLPFDVDDVGAAREAYVRWRETGAGADKDVVQLWAYCYALRYFYGKFAWERTAGPSDLDLVVERATKRIFRAIERGAVRDPDRFPQYVSVACRNLLMSYRSRRRETVEFEEGTAPVRADDAGGYDRALTLAFVRRAVEALPPALAEVARLRLLEGRDYREIADEIGRPIATTRTYYSKALHRLRKDPRLRALYDEDPAPDEADSSSRTSDREGRTSGREVSVEAASGGRSGTASGLGP